MWLRLFIKIQVLPFLPTFYFKTKVVGRKNKKFKGNVILMGNHTSMWDAVLLFCTFWTKTFYFLSAALLFNRSKRFTWFISTLGAIKVERTKTDMFAINSAIETLEKGRNLMIFPEGLRSLDGTILKFQPGAAIVGLITGKPIIPVFIGGGYGFFKQAKLVIGEHIVLERRDKNRYPSQEEIVEATQLLRNTIIELSKRL
ncbi:MAG: 1-acyl-sn-glycerol-3-phosphate acyltransferase [Clostridia bacterium]|jgi:1-acyl-sn-glycerol-3-phosphate acyltransferase|nr:1-acyl-sn-glycerol-3-phosphate acyltransferase [Clostridia bacterium]